MSFIVKGIDLPKNIVAIEVKFYIPKVDGYEKLDQEVSAVFADEYLENVIQIPKGHGAIKDTDEIITLFRRVTSINKSIMIDAIQQTDTILEAESEE